jgi:hypothetical protein
MSQFADDSMTPSPLTTTRDKWGNEIAPDRPMHTNTTAGEGAFHFDEGHYSDDWDGGYRNYGVNVSAPATSSNSVTVDNSRADRGKED